MKKKYAWLLLLNLLWGLVYFLVFYNLKINITEDLMFSPLDAKAYLEVSNEFYDFSVQGCSVSRTFFYPLLILIFYGTMGAYGLWILQLFFWIVSVNLLYLSIEKTTHNKTLSFIGSTLIVLNFSFMSLTMVALTEVSVIFLLSLLIYFLAFNVSKWNTLRSFHVYLLITILLAVIKPLFLLPLIFLLFFIMPVFYLKKYLKSPKNIFILILILIPLLFQLTLMKVKYDRFSFNNKGHDTFKYYFFSQGIQQINNISLTEAREEAQKFSKQETISYMFRNLPTYTIIYFQNLKNNINSASLSNQMFDNSGNSFFSRYMLIMNKIYSLLHLIFLLPVLIGVIYTFRKKEWNYFILFAVLSSLTYYIFFATAISFWQGDRLVIPALPLFIFLYIVISKYFFEKIRSCRKRTMAI